MNTNNLRLAILNSLFSVENEITVTLAAIKVKVAWATVVATEEEILEVLTGLINTGKVVLVKNTEDKDAFQLTECARSVLCELGEGTDELYKRTTIHHLDPHGMNDARLEIMQTMTLDQLSAAYNTKLGRDTLLVTVRTNSDEAVEAKMTENYAAGREKIESLNNLFATGLIHAHYEFDDDAIRGNEFRNSTGYYDPLTDAVFIDEKGLVVQAAKTIRFLDEKSLRRLYIVVLHPGMNIIIHDRYSFSENGFGGVLVCTAGVSFARQEIGMEPAWAQDCTYDFVMACRLFGFEYDRARNEVYMPRGRKANSFELSLLASNEFKHRVNKLQGVTAE